LFLGTTNRTKDGSTVRKCRVADRSGSVCFSLWNEQASAIEPGDILRLIKGLMKHQILKFFIRLIYYPQVHVSVERGDGSV